MPNTSKKPKPLLQSIHFYPSHIMLDYGDHKKFQICKECKNGKHIKALFNQFCPRVPLEAMAEETAIRLEKRLYHILARGVTRWAAIYQVYGFGEYAQRYCENKRQKTARTSKNKAN